MIREESLRLDHLLNDFQQLVRHRRPEFTDIDPRSGDPIRVINLLTGPALATFLSSMVTIFTSFAPLGVVLVAMLGVGVAAGAGGVAAGTGGVAVGAGVSVGGSGVAVGGGMGVAVGVWVGGGVAVGEGVRVGLAVWVGVGVLVGAGVGVGWSPNAVSSVTVTVLVSPFWL